MRKLLLVFILLINSITYAQQNEFGFHFGFGGFSSVQMNDGTLVKKASFFPGSDSLTQLKYSQWGTVSNFPIEFNYTRWTPSMSHPIIDRGFSMSFGFGGRVVNSEEWQAVDTITYDTLILQSSGEKFPVDSFITDSYTMRTVGSAMRFTAGYHFKFNWDRLDLAVGADFVIQHYAGKKREYSYRQHGTTNLPAGFQPDSTSGSNSEWIRTSESVELNSFFYGIQFPIELRFHRLEGKEPRFWFWSPQYIGRFAIQVTPAIHYLNFNGINKYYGTCSLGFKWYYDF